MDILLHFAQGAGPDVLWAVTLCLSAVTFAIHIAFAVAVLASARGRRTALVGPLLWVVATLLGGPLVAGVYWLMNVSTLAANAREQPAPARGTAR